MDQLTSQQNSILHSEKVVKKSIYKNKFQQFQEQQQHDLFYGGGPKATIKNFQLLSNNAGGIVLQSGGTNSFPARVTKLNQSVNSTISKPTQKLYPSGPGSAMRGPGQRSDFDEPDYAQTVTLPGGKTYGYDSVTDQRQDSYQSTENAQAPHGLAKHQRNKTQTAGHTTMGTPQANLNTIESQPTENAYAINLGSKVYNKKILNINDQLGSKADRFIGGPKKNRMGSSAAYGTPQKSNAVYQKNFKEDLIVFQQDQQKNIKFMEARAAQQAQTQAPSLAKKLMNRQKQTPSQQKTRQAVDSRQLDASAQLAKTQDGASMSDTKMGSQLNKTHSIEQQTHEDQGGRGAYGLSSAQKAGSKFAANSKYKTELRGVKGKKEKLAASNMLSIFDNTPIDKMPSVNSHKGSGPGGKFDRRGKFNTRGEDRGLDPSQGAGPGYVNYINGVPVSIQLDGSSPGGRPTQASAGPVSATVKQPNSWKQNMLKRNDLLNNNDVTKMQLRNELEKQNYESYLPNIDGKANQSITKKVKPNYYKNKRKQNYHNMYGDVSGDGNKNHVELLEDIQVVRNFTASQNLSSGGGGGNDFSNLHSKLQMKDKYDDSPLKANKDMTLERRAESMYVPKRVKKSKGSGSKSRSKSRNKDSKKNETDLMEKSRSTKHVQPETEKSSELLTPNKIKVKRVDKAGFCTSQKQPVTKLDASASKEGTLKNKSRTNKHLRPGSPADNKDMPYKGTGPINLELGQMSSHTKSKNKITPAGRNHSQLSSDRRESNPLIGVNLSKNFKKIACDPSLFKIQVQRKHLEHLMQDDLDEISKFEVIYKILKDQLRLHQGKLIKMKEDQRNKRLAKSPGKDRRDLNLKDFVKHIKPFEWYGPQRDLSPELKRIVKNLSCQEHKYLYCPCCKQYEEQEYDPIENMKKFMKFIKEEHEKMNPIKKKVIESKRPKDMPDDSVSEITDLEEEEVLAKYYSDKLTNIGKKRKERAESLKRIRGETIELKHVCKTIHKKRKQFDFINKDANEETIELELRQKSEGLSMQDEDQSAHQFSANNVSIQADSEERMENEMKASEIEARSPSLKSFARSTTSIYALSKSPKKTPKRTPAGNLKTKDTLFNPLKQSTEIAIQTDDRAIERRFTSRKTVRIDSRQHDSRPTIEVFRPSEEPTQTQEASKPFDPDAIKDDWVDSVTYKKAMRAMAASRGKVAGSEFDYDEDDDEKLMANTIYETQTVTGVNQSQQQDGYASGFATDKDASNAPGENEIYENVQDANGPSIGFMKKFEHKGNIKILTENEIIYIKTLLKQDTENWENKSTLADLYRHCKFTIRKLTRQMANIDNRQIFRKNRDPNRDNTLFMVYRAERLYSALTDAQKIFRHVTQLIFDSEDFELIFEKEDGHTPEDEKCMKKREQLIKRLLSQVNTFLGQYKFFGDKMQFKKLSIKEYLGLELDKIRECRKLMDMLSQQDSHQIAAMSSRVDMESNKKEIVELPKPKPVTPHIPAPGTAPKEMKELGPMSPYNAKVVPDEANSSRGARLRSSSNTSFRNRSAHLKKKKSEGVRQSRQSKNSKGSRIGVGHNILEERKFGQAMHYEDQEKNRRGYPDSSGKSVDEEGKTVQTIQGSNYRKDNNGKGYQYASGSQHEDPMSEQNPVQLDESNYEDEDKTVTRELQPPSNIHDQHTDGQTQYTMRTAQRTGAQQRPEEANPTVLLQLQESEESIRHSPNKNAKLQTPRIDQSQEKLII